MTVDELFDLIGEANGLVKNTGSDAYLTTVIEERSIRFKVAINCEKRKRRFEVSHMLPYAVLKDCAFPRIHVKNLVESMTKRVRKEWANGLDPMMRRA